MYRKVKKLPTLVGLLIIFGGLAAAIYLDRYQKTLTTTASDTQIPQDVHFTNISEIAMTVSWLTSSPTLGSVTVSSNLLKYTYIDDLDSDNIQRPRTVHFITIKNLKENTTYSIKILSGNSRCINNKFCPTYFQKTGVKLPSSLNLPPAHGTILTAAGKPANGVVVYLVVGKSMPLSSLVDSSGLWVIPLTNLRTQDFSQRPEISDDDNIQITAKLSTTEEATAVTDVKSIRQNFTIPPMTLGNSYNFLNLQSKKDLIAAKAKPNILGEKTGVASVSSPSPIDILFPKKDGDTTIDTRPRIRGVGKPGSQILITVNSAPQTGKMTVGKDGTWAWRPPKSLAPGIHHVSIQGYDKKGTPITVKRQFIVLKSGESVLGEATPSSSLTPTATTTPLGPTSTPTPTLAISLTPTLTPTVTETPIPTVTSIPITPPPSGTTQPTLLFLGTGLTLLAIGIKFLLFP